LYVQKTFFKKYIFTQDEDMVGKIMINEYFVPKLSLLFNMFSGHWQKNKLFNRCGFSMVELVTVLSIIVILATMAIPTINRYIYTTKIAACATDIRTIDKAITAYSIDKNALPPDGPAGLGALGMSDMVDPWRRPFEFKLNTPATELKDIANNPLNTDYDLYSLGQDGISVSAAGGDGNEDDIARTNNGTFVGVRP
jgi:general secretion pathway protein G